MDADADSVKTVCQALESDGTLKSMKTQLLSKVYEILLRESEENHDDSNINKPNTEPICSGGERLLFSCVRDMLQACNLTCTMSVFDNEIKNVCA